LGEIINIIKNTETVLVASKHGGPEVNAEKTKHSTYRARMISKLPVS